MALPSWNNPATVQSIHAWLEASALLFFAALVVFDVLAHIAERESAKERYFERIGLVCFGIAVIAEILAYPYGQRNDELSNRRIANLNLEAEQAMERASRSDERAALAEQHAADANKAAKGFDAKIADARREAARLTKEAEDERSARVKIEDEVAWRRLDPEQQESMGRNLESFAGMTGRLQVNGSDPEPNEFAIDIDKALQLGKWHIFEPLQMIMMGEGPVPFGTNPPPETGVIVVSTGEPRSRDAATAVVRELLALGFDAVVEGRIAQGVSTVFVTVQHRPLGPQGAAKLRAQKRNAQGPK